MIGNAAVFKGSAEKVSYVMFYAHSGKDDGKLFLGILSQRSLFYDLGRKLVMGKAIPGKDGQLLASLP